MINLNSYRKNIFHKDGYNECPHYSEDGIIIKIFETIGIDESSSILEFGEHRVLGTTTRSFRMKNFAKAIYFAGNYDLYSKVFNIIDIIKVTFKYKNLKYLKFLFNQPFKYFVTPDNILSLLDKKNVKKLDISCIDIDSYDYFIAEKLLKSEIKTKLFIVEYNPNLPINKSLSLPYPVKKLKINNKRIYGASFSALNNLFSKFDYKLIHISGYCNLFYIKNHDAKLFETPNIKNEIPRNDEDVQIFTKNYGMKGFEPSWLRERYLKKNDLSDFIEPKI
tara:strand:- start:738 stop:1571 length:834 start_codon:yes stop_codon:yes gene_type:complete